MLNINRVDRITNDNMFNLQTQQFMFEYLTTSVCNLRVLVSLPIVRFDERCENDPKHPFVVKPCIVI